MPEQPLTWTADGLCKLSGEDTAIIFGADTDAHVAGMFAAIGLLVVAIFSLSVYSSVHFLANLLNGSHVIAIALGLFWGAMIANIYYLLLFTITPPMLKGRERAHHGAAKEVTTEKKFLSRISLAFRLIFVILLAMVIAQPWLVTIFDTSQWIDRERREYRAAFIRLADSGSPGLEGNSDRGMASHTEIDRLLATNNFYTRKIQLINKNYPLSWLVTFMIVSFFILPIALKYWVRNKSNFYTIKKGREERLVLDRYEDFKRQYSTIFTDRFQIATEWYESCTDPPFNTCQKGKLQEGEEQRLLLEKIYGSGDNAESHKYPINETIG